MPRGPGARSSALGPLRPRLAISQRLQNRTSTVQQLAALLAHHPRAASRRTALESGISTPYLMRIHTILIHSLPPLDVIILLSKCATTTLKWLLRGVHIVNTTVKTAISASSPKQCCRKCHSKQTLPHSLLRCCIIFSIGRGNGQNLSTAPGTRIRHAVKS